MEVPALDLDSGKQVLVAAGLPRASKLVISPDGRRVGYSVPEGDSYSIHIGEAGAGSAESRVLCKACGWVKRFSPDGRFLFYEPEDKVRPDPKQKFSSRLLELTTGQDRPWAEHPTDSVEIGGTLGADSKWLWLSVGPPGLQASGQRYLVPWREQPIPQSE